MNTRSSNNKLDEKRLYVINLPYTITHEDIKQLFSKYGIITNLKVPKDENNQIKGFSFVTYSMNEEALRAFAELDNKIAFGRILHLQPAFEDQALLLFEKK